MRVHSLYEGA